MPMSFVHVHDSNLAFFSLCILPTWPRSLVRLSLNPTKHQERQPQQVLFVGASDDRGLRLVVLILVGCSQSGLGSEHWCQRYFGAIPVCIYSIGVVSARILKALHVFDVEVGYS